MNDPLCYNQVTVISTRSVSLDGVSHDRDPVYSKDTHILKRLLFLCLTAIAALFRSQISCAFLDLLRMGYGGVSAHSAS